MKGTDSRGKRSPFLVAWALLPLFFAACAPRPPEPPPLAYPYAADAARTFYASSSGLSESPPPSGGLPAELIPASRAYNASVLSSDGKTIVAAVNGWGVAGIASDPRTTAGGARPNYRVAGMALPSSFAGLSTAGAWPVKGGFLVQLFRDPFSQPAMQASHLVPPPPLPSARIAFIDAERGLSAAIDPFSAGIYPGYELFALLPDDGRWFAELRKDSPLRVDLKFLAVGDIVAGAGPGGVSSGSVEIGRPEFESALKPKSLKRLSGREGEGLRSALRALGPGPWLVRHRTDKGGDSWYIDAGKPEEAAPVYAWSDSDGTLALRGDGWLASSRAGGGLELLPLGAQVPGAVFTALAAAGSLAAAAWESGEFPNIDSAGLVVAPLSR